MAPVSNPPAFTSVTPLPAGQTICGGGSVTLNATSATPGTFTWNPGNIPNGSVVSPSVTTTYTVTGLFPGSCRRDSAITITVNPTPTNLVVSPATATICVPTIVPLTATGGILVGQTIVNERFETFPLTQFGVTGSGVTVAPNTTYYQQGIQSGHLTHGNSIDGQLALTTGINLSQIQNPTLSFNQIVALEQCCDSACVQFSTNGGASWSSFPASAYIGSASLLNSAVDFNSGSYSDWNTQFTDAADEPGIGPATSLWKKETINLSAYTASTNFKIRFTIKADFSVIFYGWLLDDIQINGDSQAEVSWSPTTELYSNSIATLPYSHTPGAKDGGSLGKANCFSHLYRNCYRWSKLQ